VICGGEAIDIIDTGRVRGGFGRSLRRRKSEKLSSLLIGSPSSEPCGVAALEDPRAGSLNGDTWRSARGEDGSASCCLLKFSNLDRSDDSGFIDEVSEPSAIRSILAPMPGYLLSSKVNVSDQPMISHHRPREISAMYDMIMRCKSRVYCADGCIRMLDIQLFSRPEYIPVCSSCMGGVAVRLGPAQSCGFREFALLFPKTTMGRHRWAIGSSKYP
jgi:hypothetical protein